MAIGVAPARIKVNAIAAANHTRGRAVKQTVSAALHADFGLFGGLRVVLDDKYTAPPSYHDVTSPEGCPMAYEYPIRS